METIYWDQFKKAVKEAGLSPWRCTLIHWQIKGGTIRSLVNCWPNTKRGFRYQATGDDGYSGSIADAIGLAGPIASVGQAMIVPESETDPPVGLCRRLWRWFCKRNRS